MEPASNTIEPLDEEMAELVPATVGRGTRIRRGGLLADAAARLGTRLGAAAAPLERIKFALLVYLGTRALLLAVALIEAAVRHHPLANEFANSKTLPSANYAAC